MHKLKEVNGSDGEQEKNAFLRPDAANLLASSAMFDLPLARAWMCEQLRAHGISDDVLSVMAEVPRHGFAPVSRWRVTYLNQDIWTGIAWLMSPRTVARIVDAIPRGQANSILELGTGTGYQTALLALTNKEVLSIEASPACAVYARGRLSALAVNNVRVTAANMLRVATLNVKFDAIIINVAITSVPAVLFSLLRSGTGVIIAPTIVSDWSQRLQLYCVSGSSLKCVDLGACWFQPGPI